MLAQVPGLVVSVGKGAVAVREEEVVGEVRLRLASSSNVYGPHGQPYAFRWKGRNGACQSLHDGSLLVRFDGCAERFILALDDLLEEVGVRQAVIGFPIK